jgi:hypothetical protein
MHVFDSLNVLGYRRSGNSLLSEVIPDIAAVRPASGNKEHQLLIFFQPEQPPPPAACQDKVCSALFQPVQWICFVFMFMLHD